jgi:hypothetical protein
MDTNKHELLSQMGLLLRLTEARYRARVCDPQRGEFLLVSIGVHSWFQNS